MATKERAWKGKEPLGEVRQPRLDDFEESQTCSKELLDGGSTNPSIMANDLKNISEATLCRKNTIKISLADSVSEENPYYNYSLGANNPTEKFPSDRQARQFLNLMAHVCSLKNQLEQSSSKLFSKRQVLQSKAKKVKNMLQEVERNENQIRKMQAMYQQKKKWKERLQRQQIARFEEKLLRLKLEKKQFQSEFGKKTAYSRRHQTEGHHKTQKIYINLGYPPSHYSNPYQHHKGKKTVRRETNERVVAYSTQKSQRSRSYIASSVENLNELPLKTQKKPQYRQKFTSSNKQSSNPVTSRSQKSTIPLDAQQSIVRIDWNSNNLQSQKEDTKNPEIMAKTKGARYENKGPNVFINKTDIPSPVGIDTQVDLAKLCLEFDKDIPLVRGSNNSEGLSSGRISKDKLSRKNSKSLLRSSSKHFAEDSPQEDNSQDHLQPVVYQQATQSIYPRTLTPQQIPFTNSMIIDESEGELLKQSAVNLVLVSEQPSDSSETDAAPNIVPLMVTAAKLIKNQSQVQISISKSIESPDEHEFKSPTQKIQLQLLKQNKSADSGAEDIISALENRNKSAEVDHSFTVPVKFETPILKKYFERGDTSSSFCPSLLSGGEESSNVTSIALLPSSSKMGREEAQNMQQIDEENVSNDGSQLLDSICLNQESKITVKKRLSQLNESETVSAKPTQQTQKQAENLCSTQTKDLGLADKNLSDIRLIGVSRQSREKSQGKEPIMEGQKIDRKLFDDDILYSHSLIIDDELDMEDIDSSLRLSNSSVIMKKKQGSSILKKREKDDQSLRQSSRNTHNRGNIHSPLSIQITEEENQED